MRTHVLLWSFPVWVHIWRQREVGWCLPFFDPVKKAFNNSWATRRDSHQCLFKNVFLITMPPTPARWHTARTLTPYPAVILCPQSSFAERLSHFGFMEQLSLNCHSDYTAPPWMEHRWMLCASWCPLSLSERGWKRVSKDIIIMHQHWKGSCTAYYPTSKLMFFSKLLFSFSIKSSGLKGGFYVTDEDVNGWWFV